MKLKMAKLSAAFPAEEYRLQIRSQGPLLFVLSLGPGGQVRQDPGNEVAQAHFPNRGWKSRPTSERPGNEVDTSI